MSFTIDTADRLNWRSFCFVLMSRLSFLFFDGLNREQHVVPVHLYTHTRTRKKKCALTQSLVMCLPLKIYVPKSVAMATGQPFPPCAHRLPPTPSLLNQPFHPPTPPLLTAKLLTTLVYKRGGSMCIARLTTITTIITRSSLFLSPALQMKHFIFFIFKYSFFFFNHFVLFFCSLNLSPPSSFW